MAEKVLGVPRARLATHSNRSDRNGGEILKNNEDVTQAVGELIRLHDDVLARVFALQSLLQEVELVSAEEVQERTEEFRKRFDADLVGRFPALQEKTDATEIRRLQRILDGHNGPPQ